MSDFSYITSKVPAGLPVTPARPVTAVAAIILEPGLLAARPAAASVIPGSLYYATDDEVIYRSDGAAWDVFSGVFAGLRTLVPGNGTELDTSVPGQVGVDTHPADIREYFAAGSGSDVPPTWALPTTMVRLQIAGAGGGGGTGCVQASATTRGGGGGGASGNYTDIIVPFGDIPLSAGNIAYVVGAGGVPGADVTTDNTDGNPGTAGGASSIASTFQSDGGGAGGGGTILDGGAAGLPGLLGMFKGRAGGKGADGVVAATDPEGGVPGATSGGGGGGGGLTVANAGLNASAGGDAEAYTDGTVLGGAAGVFSVSVAGDGANAIFFIASGGGGGARGNGALNGLPGGAGGFPGAGGGGGGATVNGRDATHNSANTGGDGAIRITYFR